MSKKQISLTEGPLARQILFFSLPLIASHVLQVLFNMADVAVVGQFAGPMALGSVGSTTILVTMFTAFLIGLSNGVNVIVARYLGADQPENVSKTVHTSAIVCLITGLIIMIGGIAFARSLLNLLSTKDELIEGAVLYLRIYLIGMPALAIFNFGNAVFSAAGNTKKPLYFLTAAGVINVLLNLFFVIVCGRSVDGVALASIIAQYISAILIVAELIRSRECYALRVNKLRIYGDKARLVLSIGLPSAGQSSIFQLANLFIQASVNSFDAILVSGNSAAANADPLVYDVMAAFYTACASFMSQNYGARKKERVIRSYYITTAYSFGAAAVMGVLLVLFGRQFLSLFTTDQTVIEAGLKRLNIMGFSYCVSAFMDNTIAASRGLGKSVMPMVFVFLGSCVFRIIWVYTIFDHFHTVPSLYLLYVFSWSLTAAAEIAYFVRIYKRQMAAMERSIS